MKTAWKNTGSAENASIDVGLYIKVVGNEGVDNFHKGCAWQIGISKDSTVQEAEVQQWILASDSTQSPDTLLYGVADLNVSELN